MPTFENVAVQIKANVYADGTVTSRTVLFADGTKKTLGVMMPGEYTFSTDAAEKMEVTAGQVEVKLADDIGWSSYAPGQAFDVPANTSFTIRVNELFDYVCSYLAD